MTTRYEIWIRGCTVCKDALYDTVFDKKAAVQVRKAAEDAMDVDCGGRAVIEEKEDK